jgi:hypothetical protein
LYANLAVVDDLQLSFFFLVFVAKGNVQWGSDFLIIKLFYITVWLGMENGGIKAKKKIG